MPSDLNYWKGGELLLKLREKATKAKTWDHYITIEKRGDGYQIIIRCIYAGEIGKPLPTFGEAVAHAKGLSLESCIPLAPALQEKISKA